MDTLKHRYSEKIKGILEGFDRIVFKGMLRPLCFAAGMQIFLKTKGVLNKGYKEWATSQSSVITQNAEEYTLGQCGTGIRYLNSYKIRKEAAAHEQQAKQGIKSGLIGTWSCVESCNTFKAVYDKNAGYPQIRVDKNSLKLYNEQNVLRFEFTMNDPTRFRIWRNVEGSAGDEKKFLPMRKGIADIYVRAQISSSRIKNLTEQVAVLDESMTVSDIIAKVAQPIKSNGKRYRGLDVTGKDLMLLNAVGDPKYNVDSLTNKHLQKTLIGTPWANGLSGRKLSGRIGRHLRLLREHGIIKKLPNQHRYILTDKGRLLTTALNQFLGAKVCDLAKLAA